MKFLPLPAIALIALGTTPQPVQAAARSCTVNLNGARVTLTYDRRDVTYQSLPERWSPWAPACPSEVVMSALMPGRSEDFKAGYCLETDPKTGAYLAAVKGPRDNFGRCRTVGRVCRAVNSTRKAALAAAGTIGSTVLGSEKTLAATGSAIAERSPNAVIATAASSYIAGALGNVTTTAVAIATAPSTLIGAAAGAVVIGGALLVCQDTK